MAVGLLYAGASYLAAVHDAHGDLANRGALIGLGVNLAATLIGGYSGKVLGRILSSESEEMTQGAFSLTKNWGKSSLPYLSKIPDGENFGDFLKKPDWVSTGVQLGNNAVWDGQGCYGSFSWPCASS